MAINNQGQTQYVEPNGISGIDNIPVNPIPQAPIQQSPYGNIPSAPPPTQVTNSADLSPLPPMSTAPMSNQQYAKEMIGSLGERQAAISAEAENVSAGKQQEANIQQQASERDAQHAAYQKSLMDKAIIDSNKRDEEIRAMVRKAYTEKIDPERWWNEKSTGGKLMAGIGVILGGIGSGLQRSGRNPAMDVINNAINQDIDAQRHHIDTSFKSISEMHRLNEDAFNKDLHRQVWENNYRTSALERVKLDLGAVAAKTGSETVRNNALMGIQDLTDQQLKIRNQQYLLAQQAAAAQAAQLRKLSESADKDVQELIKEKGVSVEDATMAVYSRPHYRALVQNRIAPNEVIALSGLRTQAAQELQSLKAKGLSDEDAMKQITADPRFQPLFKPVGVVVPDVALKEKEVEKERERTVMVTVPGPNGNLVTKPMLAVNKEAAKDYKEYSDAHRDVDMAFAELQQAWKNGDVGAYEAARGQLLDSMPKFMLGSSASGPTRAQARDTYGKLIPEYRHWYTFGGMVQGRTDEAFKVVQNMIDQRKSTIDSNTFGAETPSTPKPVPTGDTSQKDTLNKLKAAEIPRK